MNENDDVEARFNKAFSPENIVKMHTTFKEKIAFDDLVQPMIRQPKVGDRVSYKDKSNEYGTIVCIALSHMPFRVKWDNTSDVDYVDWYYGSQLEFV